MSFVIQPMAARYWDNKASIYLSKEMEAIEPTVRITDESIVEEGILWSFVSLDPEQLLLLDIERWPY